MVVYLASTADCVLLSRPFRTSRMSRPIVASLTVCLDKKADCVLLSRLVARTLLRSQDLRQPSFLDVKLLYLVSTADCVLLSRLLARTLLRSQDLRQPSFLDVKLLYLASTADCVLLSRPFRTSRMSRSIVASLTVCLDKKADCVLLSRLLARTLFTVFPGCQTPPRLTSSARPTTFYYYLPRGRLRSTQSTARSYFGYSARPHRMS